MKHYSILIFIAMICAMGCSKKETVVLPTPEDFPQSQTHGHDGDTDVPEGTAPDRSSYIQNGALPGVFSISETEKVHFSMGNLQYHAKKDKWQFAPSQSSVIGDKNKNIDKDYNDWIDLFGWGTSGYNGCYPYTYSLYATYGGGLSNIAGTNYDWGIYNAISNGGNKAGLWRCMSVFEWDYLFMHNTFGFGKINGVTGLFLIPENWECPQNITFYAADGMSITPFSSNNQLHVQSSNNILVNSYTSAQWQWLEASGVVFLPNGNVRMAGLMLTGATYHSTNSSTCCSSDAAHIKFGHYQNSASISFGVHGDPKCAGASVRLIQSIKQ